MSHEILAAAITGAIAGGLGGVVGMLLGKLTGSGGKATGSSWAVLGTLCGMLAVGSADLRQIVGDTVRPPSSGELLGRKMLAIPEYQQRVSGKSPEQVQAISRQLSARGMSKLPDDLVLEWAQLVVEVLFRADELTCAKFAQGRLGGADLMHLIEALPAAHQAGWLRVISSAVEAELGVKQFPIPKKPSTEQIARAFEKLKSEVIDEDRARLEQNLPNLEGLSHPEACWTARALYQLVTEAEGETQAITARALVMK